MPYIVNIQIGSRSRGNFARSQSVPLPNKARVRAWIKRNNLGNVNTKVTIKNTRLNSTTTLRKGIAIYFGEKILLKKIRGK